MNIQKFAKREIALRQIETALELYFGQRDLFSVITLAGAAEEILGGLLLERSGQKGARGKLSSVFQILRPGGEQARRKHRLAGLASGQELDDFVQLDPSLEAVFLLGRAIEDYVALSGAPSANMLKFTGELARG